MSKSLIFALAMLLIASPLQAKKVYKHTDENGNTIYSDEPLEGAKEIILPKAQTYSSPEIDNSSQGPEITPKAVTYELAIIEPDNDFVVQNGVDSLQVKLFMQPELKEYHVVQLFLDDKPLAAPQTQTNFELSDLSRGSYKLKAKIFDKKNKMKVLKESQPISIHVNRAMLPGGHQHRALSIGPFNQGAE